MIAYLDGLLAEKKPSFAIVDVGGVGYSVFIPDSTYQKLPQIGERVRMLTFTHVREDAFLLYGFSTSQEKEMFEMLLGVNGIGPKSALGILSSIPASDFYHSIADEDLGVLTKISGIGKKTAQRLIVELKEKLGKLDGWAKGTKGITKQGDASEEALAALVALGLDRLEARKSLEKVGNSGRKITAEELVKKALGASSPEKLSRK